MSVTPLVSILIPNYNNGAESSLSRERDLIGDLLESLQSSLSDDPTPVEIIIVDDGSTDDSLATIRQWSQETWSQGGGESRPFCRVIELEHTGVLSVVANRLMDEAQGQYCCRLDGDIVIHTRHWASRLREAFESVPESVGVIGPKQLMPDGTVHAAGDWLLHPRGYHHIAKGAQPNQVTRSMEVDHVMGCFYCMKRAVWDAVGPYDPSFLRGQTIDYTVRARLAGWRVFFIPTIEFTHYHMERDVRKNSADTGAGIGSTIAHFEAKWGFDRLTPDLDVVREKYAGTPLLWNARVFGPRQITGSDCAAPLTLENSRWTSYQNDERLQKQIDDQAHVVAKVVELGPDHRRVVQYGCGDGLLVHFLAQAGLDATGIDVNPDAVDLARSVTARSSYGETPSPRFEIANDGEAMPLAEDSADVFAMFGAMETHPNPIALLREAHRVLRPNGKLAVFSKARSTPLDSDLDALHLYTKAEMADFIGRCGMFQLMPVKTGSMAGSLLLIAANAATAGRNFIVGKQPELNPAEPTPAELKSAEPKPAGNPAVASA